MPLAIDNTPNPKAMDARKYYVYCCAWAVSYMVARPSDKFLLQLACSHAVGEGIVFG